MGKTKQTKATKLHLNPNTIAAIKNCISVNNTLFSELKYNTYNAKQCLSPKYSNSDYKNFCNWLNKIIRKYEDVDFFGITVTRTDEAYAISTPSKLYAYFVISTLNKIDKNDCRAVYNCIYNELKNIDYITTIYEGTEDIKLFYLMLERNFHFSVFERVFNYINSIKLTSYPPDLRLEFMDCFYTTFSALLEKCLKNENLEIIINENFSFSDAAFYLKSVDCFSFYEISVTDKSIKEIMPFITIKSNHYDNPDLPLKNDEPDSSNDSDLSTDSDDLDDSDKSDSTTNSDDNAICINVDSPHTLIHKLYSRINSELEAYNNGQSQKLTFTPDEETVLKKLEKQLLLCHYKALATYIINNPFIDFCCRCIDCGININIDSFFALLKTEDDYYMANDAVRDFYEGQHNDKIPQVALSDIEIAAPTITADSKFVDFICVMLNAIRAHKYKPSFFSYMRLSDFNIILNSIFSLY